MTDSKIYLIPNPPHVSIVIYKDGVTTRIDGQQSEGFGNPDSGKVTVNNPQGGLFGNLIIDVNQVAGDVPVAGAVQLNIPPSEVDAKAQSILDKVEDFDPPYSQVDENGVLREFYDTEKQYDPLDTNSNSVAKTLLDSADIDFDEAIVEVGSHPNLYPGSDVMIDTDGDDEYTIETDENVTIIDNGGDDIITVEEGAHVNITNDEDPDSSNTVVMEGIDRDDVIIVREGDDLIIIADNGNGRPTQIVLIDHFSDNGSGTKTLLFEPDADGNGGNGDPVDLDDPSNYSSFGVLGAYLLPWLEGVLDALWDAIRAISPLTLDLDGDGIELVSLEDSNVYWDIDEDGFAEKSGWVAADDGLLVIDLNGDGVINDHSELFGTSINDGFTVLSAYDTNGDSVINIDDAQFADLLVWQDANQNGISEAAELYTLADLDIVSIDLNAATPHNMYIEGHNISHVSSYTVDDGVNGAQTFDIVDVWFGFDNVNTNYIGEYDFDFSSLFVATIRGYGVLPDLHVQASIDNDTTDPDGLMSLLQDFEMMGFDQLFVDDGSAMNCARDIMFRWAGVDDIDPTSRGQWIDARELGFLEALSGEGFVQEYGNRSDPGSISAQHLERAFSLALHAITGKLIAQAAGASLFNSEVVYSPLTDTFEGFTEFNQDALDSLLAMSVDGNVVTDKTAFWVNVVNVVNHSIGIDNLSAPATGALESTLQASDSSLSIALILEKITKNIDDNLSWTPAGDSISGSSSDDTYDGSVGDDYYNAGYGDDTLNGGIGDDTLYGGNGNDVLNGQLGDDYLKGDGGNDTYLFSLGHGNDTITDSGGTDKIVFDEGITLADLTIVRTGIYDVSITIDPNVGSGFITIADQISVNGGAINTLEFHDGSVFDLNTMDYTYTGNATDETIRGVRVGYGGTGVDTIYGMDGNDTIYGYMSSYSYTAENYLYGGNGDDSIYGDRSDEELYGEAGDDYLAGNHGDDQLTGGLGDDFIKGDAGADTYYFNYGDGNDTYNETLGNSTVDTIVFGTGITFSDLSIRKISDYDVKIDIDGGAGGSIVIEEQLRTASDVLDLLEFSDGSIVDLNTLGLTSTGTASADILYGAKAGVGSTGVDTIYGMDGDDTIYGYKVGTYSTTAENYLYGGDGDDSIYGDRSDEELYGEAGDDYISGNRGDDLISGGAGSDTLIGGNGADTFVYEAGSTSSSIDTISDFDTSENDAIDIADLLSGYDPLSDAITDFVQITDNGTDSILSIDADGGADNFVQIATLTGVTGLTDEEALETSGNLVAA